MDLLIFSGRLESFFFFGTDFTNLHEFFLKDNFEQLRQLFFSIFNVVPVVSVVFHFLPTERITKKTKKQKQMTDFANHVNEAA